MLYLLTHYWIWLAAAFVVGVATPLLAHRLGWAADLPDYWLQRIGVLLAIAIVLIAARMFSGKPELLFEAGAGLVIAYMVGGVAGGFSAGLLPARFEGWWVGLFATGLILFVFGIVAMPKIEPDLRERVADVVKGAGADPLNFDVSGRDVLLPADIGNDKLRGDLSKQILEVAGVRAVSEVEDLTGPALAAKTIAKLQAEVAAKAEKDKAEAEAKEAADKAAAEAAAKTAMAKDAAAKQVAAKAKAEAEAKEAAAKEAAAKEAAAKEAAAKEAATKEAAAKEAAAKAAADQAAKPAPAAAAIKTADAAGTATIASAEACQSKLSALVSAKKINFDRGSAEIDKASLPVLKELASTISLCPSVSIEVGGHTDANGSKSGNEALSKRRAEAVVDNLTKAGIGSAKLSAVGYGSAKPVGSNDNADGRAQNRRIEFVVK
jgi:outer membrane protein OmpA-like peptidoglycan-associated protein